MYYLIPNLSTIIWIFKKTKMWKLTFREVVYLPKYIWIRMNTSRCFNKRSLLIKKLSGLIAILTRSWMLLILELSRKKKFKTESSLLKMKLQNRDRFKKNRSKTTTNWKIKWLKQIEMVKKKALHFKESLWTVKG